MAACCTRLSLPSQLKRDWLVRQWKCFRLELFKMVERDFGLEISATQLHYKETVLDQVSKLNPQWCLIIWTCQSFLSFMTMHLLSDVIINHKITAFYFLAALWQTGNAQAMFSVPGGGVPTWPPRDLSCRSCLTPACRVMRLSLSSFHTHTGS